MELSQLQRLSILTAWRTYQDAVGAARRQSHQSIDVLREQAEKWALQEHEPQAGGAHGVPGHTEAAAEVRVHCWYGCQAGCQAGRRCSCCLWPPSRCHTCAEATSCMPTAGCPSSCTLDSRHALWRSFRAALI
jgi:hypothetical protein